MPPRAAHISKPPSSAGGFLVASIWCCLLFTWSAIALCAEPAAAGSPSSLCGQEDVLAGLRPVSTQDALGNTALMTDGSVPTEGTDWDTPAAVILETNSGVVTYDLGAVRDIGAIYLQADANDTYTVWGATSLQPSSFKPLVQLPNVVDRGPGLRNRTAEFAATPIRFLRVGPGEGDGAYSISEIAAYCHAPAPFPPAFKPVAAASTAPPANVPGPRPAVETKAIENNWLVLGLALAFVGLAVALSQRRSRQAAYSPQSGAAARGSATLSQRLLCLLFFASGCAALIYEVIWMHLLRLVVGASALSVAIVLASFMGGMFLGSLFYARLVRRTLNPIVVYACIEMAIGVFGLLMPLILPAVQHIYIGLFGYGALGIALRALISAVLLLPPTALMGATLPAIARRYDTTRRGMAALTALYAANTLGAVVGCLVSAFLLLAVWDVWIATLTAATLNFAIGLSALGLRHTALQAREPSARTATASANAGPRAVTIAVYMAAGLSGLTSLGSQVIWTRLLTLLFGASVYAFAIILSVFLAGLGIGSAWASRLVRRGADPVRCLMYSQLALVPAMLLGGYLLAAALPFGSPPGWIPIQALHALDIVRTVVVVLPATIFWGTSFPFALAAAGAGQDDGGHFTGLVYASNTVGAIVGALGVSFWTIPGFGTHRSGQCLLLIASLSGAGLLLAMRRSASRRVPGQAYLFDGDSGILWALALGALAVGLLPAFPKEFLAHGRYLVWFDPRDQYPYVSEGAASTVAVHVGPDGFSNFHVSGRVEATNNPNDLRTERLIGHLSAFTHPNPESVLVVGLGAGVTAGALTLHPEVKRIVICEIEPRVVGATNQFAKENYSVLTNPRVQLVFDDARHFLATTHEKFDIITSDPIHPWVRGNSILFSKEYYSIVKAHLKPGGLASQWVPLYETSELAIQIQAKTFMSAFADGTVWNTITNNRGYDVIFIGTNGSMRIDLRNIQARIDSNAPLAASLRDVKLGGALSLLSTYGTRGSDMKAWLAGVPVNRDFSLKLEYISGLAMNSHHADDIYAHMIEGRKFPEQLFDATPESLSALERRILGEPAR
jgi:spermidine synthase